MSSNIGWLFHKGYYYDLDFLNLKNDKNIKNLENKITTILNQNPTLKEDEPLGNIYFEATTTYPGLLLGSGNTHGINDIDGDIQIGFSFDYTTGLPIISGSTIKGVLRSAFEHSEYIKELVDDKSLNVADLEIEIFGQKNSDNSVSQGKDIFFDAVVTKKGSRLLRDDYLAPHGKDPLKNPIPIRFLKVAPNVTFKFDFLLHDGILSKEKKAILFANIIRDLGIGAKTNVGYGKFNDNLPQKVQLQIEEIKKLEEDEQRKKDEAEKDEAEKKVLDSYNSNIEKIKYLIKDFGKNDTKLIHEKIVAFELNSDEKKELLEFLETKIGTKPKPKNKASIKWAIKVYELLES